MFSDTRIKQLLPEKQKHPVANLPAPRTQWMGSLPEPIPADKDTQKFSPDNEGVSQEYKDGTQSKKDKNKEKLIPQLKSYSYNWIWIWTKMK